MNHLLEETSPHNFMLFFDLACFYIVSHLFLDRTFLVPGFSVSVSIGSQAPIQFLDSAKKADPQGQAGIELWSELKCQEMYRSLLWLPRFFLLFY